ncbi:hypothetical protein [Tissierella sp. Yu-01]|nr:hypothetical protein [Tissierella sp. Yu-01]WFA08837.1 hypothetical protein P3962_14095 [Tissierella sp. Yu-01]
MGNEFLGEREREVRGSRDTDTSLLFFFLLLVIIFCNCDFF